MARNDTHMQYRATCPACFAVQAVRDGRLVQHGYRRPQHWNANVGTCSGAGRMHFGTPQGRDFTAEIAARLRAQADRDEATSAEVLAGTAPVMQAKLVARGVRTSVVLENPTRWQREAYARDLQYRATATRRDAAEFEAMAAGWVPAEPVALQVESKGATLVHWRGGHYGGRACASSAMGAQRGWATVERAHVTCGKCKAVMARTDARKAAATA